MKKLLIFLGALAAYGTDCTISDTVRTPFGGYFAGRIVVALNGPGSAQPLYSGSQTLTGWQTTIEVPASANGAVAVTLVCTDTITPAGTSYSARYQPTSGSPWSETWTPTTGTTTIRAMRATTVPTPTTTFQASQIVPGSNGQVLTTTAGATAWGSVPACATCVVTSGSYADPAWITSLAGSKVSGAVASATTATTATSATTATALAANGTNCAAGTFPLGVDASGNSESCTALPTTITGTANQITASASTGAVTLSLPATITGLTSVTSTGFTGALTGNASTATALATPRTIAGVSFNGTANISIPSTGLSDTANIVRNNAANTYTAGSKQTFAHSATTAGLNVGVQAAAPSSPAQGDVFFNSTLTRKGVYDGTQWRYELYAPSSGTGVVSWDGTSLSASTTLAGLSSVTSTSFVGALTGNASTATALSSTVASGRLWIGQGTGVPTSSANLVWDTVNGRLGVGTGSPGQTVDFRAGGSGAGVLRLQNDSTGGYSAVDLYDSSSTLLASFGYGNSAAAAFTSQVFLGSRSNVPLLLLQNTTERARIAATTGNLLIGGGTTDGNYRLDVNSSGSSGTFRVYDQTATTGNTKEVIRAGAGQSTNLTEWQNSAGTAMAFIDASGTFSNGGQTGAILNQTQVVQLGSDRLLVWGSTADYRSTKDLGLARNASGVLEINNGTAGTYRDLRVRSVFITQSTPAASTDACTAGALWADASYVYACTSSGVIKRATLASF